MWNDLLKEIDQPHILEAYNKASEEERKHLDKQIELLNTTYPGGIREYYLRALKLLKDSKDGANPYEQYSVGKPNGVSINFNDLQTLEKYETLGFKQFEHTAFVLVAGGLGERLGYPGIKISIPMELLTGKPFIRYYAEYILAFQNKFCPKGCKIPLAIMTSDDTHAKTVEILENNKYFGLEQGQVTIMKQQKVPAMIDNQAHFALSKDKLEIETKPHGHGDVHMLIHSKGLGPKWEKEGKKWIIVFQDTNPFAFRSFPLLLGITSEKDYDFNSICVPRKPDEAVGALTTLVHKQTGKILTVNVEYNQLGALFKQSGGQKTDEAGYSLYPGNINCFAIKISKYVEVLNKTGGNITEFINPKYADATRTAFKSSTRLQCLMQDYPKLLENCDKVGFADIPKSYSFTTVKNDLTSANIKIKAGLSGESAGSCQADFYDSNRHLLRLAGAIIVDHQAEQAGGAELKLHPMISFSPNFATCYTELKTKVNKLKVSKMSSLIIESDCVLQNVVVDGHLKIDLEGVLTVTHEEKDYRHFVGLIGGEDPYLQIRGYMLKQKTA